MDFTIWVTRRCNLSCKYCYEGNNKLAASMDIKTADKTIEFICKTIKKVDENINVIFHGGEPLLEYDLIKYFIKSLKENIDTRRINFGITTNGTIINDEIYNFTINEIETDNNKYSEINLIYFNEKIDKRNIVIRNNNFSNIKITFSNKYNYVVEIIPYYENEVLKFKEKIYQKK